MIFRDDPLFAVWAKIYRAKKHIKEIDGEIQLFLKGNPYRVVAQVDPETREDVFYVRVAKDVPLSWGTIVGDAVHNLRSALDLLVCCAVVANGGKIKRSTGFPIGENVDEFEAGLRKKAAGIPAEAARVMRSFHPYKSGHDALDVLWKLHRLDVLDKHRLLIPVGAAHRSTIITAVVEAPELETPVALAPFPFVTPKAVFPLKDGTEILRLAPEPDFPNLKINTKYQPTFEIAFGEGQIVDGEPIVPTLQRFLTIVSGVVKRLAAGVHGLQPPSP